MFDRIDAFTRPAAIGIALFVALVLLRSARGDLRARLGALSAVGTAAYLVCSASSIIGVAKVPIVPLCIGNSVFFWWFVRSLLEDEFRLDRWAFAPLIAVLALGLGRIATGDGRAPTVNSTIVIVHNLVIAGLVGHLFYIAWSGFADDLLDTRRRFRMFFLIAGGVVSIGIAIAEVALMGGAAPSWAVALQSSVLLAILSWAGSTALVLGPGALSFGPQNVQEREQPAPEQENRSWRDQAVEAALRRLMDEEQVFREHNLAIATLAQRLKVPEHNLRRLINTTLGHRNFNAFVNGYRISWAKAALADSAKSRLPILTIAYDAGFASLAPFNRAFRAEVGQSPRDYRARVFATERPIDPKKS
jgi:AraC-like DNA-binding protein